MFLFRSNNKLSNIDFSYLIITFLIIIYFTITYSPPIISLWESAEIYLDFLISEVQTKGVFNAHPQDTLICMGNK